MKRRTHPMGKSGHSSYGKKGKHPFDYSAMYNKAPWLRRPNGGDTPGQSHFGYLSTVEDLERVEEQI